VFADSTRNRVFAHPVGAGYGAARGWVREAIEHTLVYQLKSHAPLASFQANLPNC
jgi:hypothetical protein